jgi:hypothetical protein
MGRMRIRIALGLAFLATAIGFVIDMTGSAPRLAGDDKVRWPAPAFTDVVPGGGKLCVGNTVLPNDAGSIEMMIGTYGRLMPRITLDFVGGAGKPITTGAIAAGTPQGPDAVTPLPLRYPHGPSTIGTLCLHVGGAHPLAFGGDTFAVAAAATTVDGRPQAGRPSILFYRPGRDSWWALLGVLDLRFGLGKSPIFGDWTLPVIFVAALALWIGVARLLLKELR